MSAPSQHSCEPEPLRRRIRTVAISNPDTGGGPEQLRELQNRRYAFASSVGELLTRAEAGQQPVQGPALYGVECDGPGSSICCPSLILPMMASSMVPMIGV